MPSLGSFGVEAKVKEGRGEHKDQISPHLPPEDHPVCLIALLAIRPVLFDSLLLLGRVATFQERGRARDCSPDFRRRVVDGLCDVFSNGFAGAADEEHTEDNDAEREEYLCESHDHHPWIVRAGVFHRSHATDTVPVPFDTSSTNAKPRKDKTPETLGISGVSAICNGGEIGI